MKKIVFALMFLCAAPRVLAASSSYNFNGTAIPAGRTVWFTSVFKVNGTPQDGATLSILPSQIALGSQTVAVPGGTVTFSSRATSAATRFDGAQWQTTLPLKFSGNGFLTALALPVTSALPGGLKANWTATFGSTPAGMSLNWQWSAAVYTQFSSDPNALLVKAVDDNHFSAGSDPAGSPEAFKKYVTGGAGGGGGANYTGGLSGTVAVIAQSSAPAIASFTASQSLIAAGGSAVLSARFTGGSGVINPGGIAIASGGSVSVSPAATTTYTLTVGAATASVTVSVDRASATLGVAGGTITAPSGASLSIPYGALDGSVALSLEQIAGGVYEIDPQNILFARPVTLSLPLGGANNGSIYVSVGGGAFTAIGGTIANGSISVQIPQPGLYYVGPAQTTRTVMGVGQITWLSASARSSEPIDFGAQGVEALIPDGAGGYTHFPGSAGATRGTFVIPNVPIGPYVLHSGQQYLVTASNTPDLGSVHGGRPVEERLALSDSTVLNLNVTNMAPWDPGGWFEFYSTEADDWDFQTDRFATLNSGDTSASLPIDLSQIDVPGYAIQGSLGDSAILAQLVTQTSSTGIVYQAMTRAARITPPFDLLDGQTVNATVALNDVSQGNTLSIDYRGTQFVAALNQDGNPGHQTVCDVCGGFAGVLAQAGEAQDGFYDANADPLLLNDYAPAGTDILSGVMTYGAPSDTTLAGNWGLIFDARWLAYTPLTPLPGTLGNGGGGGTYYGFRDSVDWVTTTAAAQSGPITPPISLPINVAINGAPFFAGGGNIGLTPTLSWSPPRLGHADIYSIQVHHLFANPNNNRTAAATVANIATAATSFTLPPGILQPGEAYVFTVSAGEATSPASLAALGAPFRSSIDVATGSTSSGIFWTGTPPPPSARVTTIQGGLNYPWGLTVTQSALYWTERGDTPWGCASDSGTGRIWTANLDGSNPHVLVAGQHDPMGVVSTGSALFWSSDAMTYDASCNQTSHGTLQKLDLASNQISLIAANQNAIGTALVASGGSVFWSGMGMQALYAGSTTPSFLGWFGGVNLASDGSNLYWTDYGNYPQAPGGQVWSLPLQGGSPVSIASGQPQTWDVETSGGRVFFSDQAWQQSFPASINSVSSSGGPVTTIATGNEIMKVFAVDAASAYYISNGVLYTVPLDGSAAPRILAPLQNGGCPEGKMAVEGHNVYWTDTCSQSVQHASW